MCGRRRTGCTGAGRTGAQLAGERQAANDADGHADAAEGYDQGCAESVHANSAGVNRGAKHGCLVGNCRRDNGTVGTAPGDSSASPMTAGGLILDVVR
jgi:hypothetical protein